MIERFDLVRRNNLIKRRFIKSIHMFKLVLFSFLTVTYIAMSCDISGLDKVTVVRSLWKESVVTSDVRRFNPEFAAKTEIADEDIQQALDNGFIDYLNCRVIKIDFSKSVIDTYLYNRDNGIGDAERIISCITKIE